MLNNAYQNYPAESQPFPVLTCTEEKVAQNAIGTKCHCLKNLNVEEFLELEFEHHMQMGRILNAKHIQVNSKEHGSSTTYLAPVVKQKLWLVHICKTYNP